MTEFNFQLNEIVLCFHGPLIYEAKILKTEYRDHTLTPLAVGPHYFVHYKGWNDKWDEWVPESRLLKNTEENLNKQKSLTSVIKSTRKFNSTAPEPKKFNKKPYTASGVDQDEEVKPEMKLPIQDSLKSLLVDDWENVTKSQKIVKVPAFPTVTDIMASFITWGIKNEPLKFHDIDKLEEICSGIKEYLNFGLGTVLLYSFERIQYKDILSKYPGKSMSDLYGVVHLLRLLIKMPIIISQLNYTQENIEILKENFILLLRFLDEKKDQYFRPDTYEYAHSEYIARAKNI